MARQYIVHYGEVGLKGHNRINFERRLVSNIQTALSDLEGPITRRFHSYILVSAPETVAGTEIEDRLRRVPGIVYFAPDGGGLERAIGSSHSGPVFWRALDSATDYLPDEVGDPMEAFLDDNPLPEEPVEIEPEPHAETAPIPDEPPLVVDE